MTFERFISHSRRVNPRHYPFIGGGQRLRTSDGPLAAGKLEPGRAEKRSPKGSGRLGAPAVPAQAPLWKTGAVVMVVTALAFPLAGGVLLFALLLDWLLISRVSMLKTTLG